MTTEIVGVMRKEAQTDGETKNTHTLSHTNRCSLIHKYYKAAGPALRKYELSKYPFLYSLPYP